MKKILFFYLPNCPFCVKAKRYLDELLTDPYYADIEIDAVNEATNKKRSDAYDYSLVPCFFIDEKKVFEGICGYEDVKAVLEIALGKNC